MLADRLAQLAERAGALMDAADPGAAFVGFFTGVVEGATTKITIADALSDAGVTDDGTPEPVAQAGERVRRRRSATC